MVMRKIIIAFILVSWSVRGLGQEEVNLYIEHTFVETGNSIEIPISTNNFTEIDGFQFSIHWDSSMLRFDTLINFGVPQMTIDNFGLTRVSSGQLTSAWTGPLTSSTTLQDSTILFNIRFDAIGGCRNTTSIQFSNTPTEIEFLQIDGLNIIDRNFSTSDGIIDIYCPLNLDSIYITDNNCNGDSLGRIEVFISGGIEPYQYIWNNEENGSVIDSLGAGNYNFELRDSLNNSLFIENLIVEEGMPIFIDIGNDSTICNDSALNITGIGSDNISSVLWYKNDALIQTAMGLSLSIDESGTYTCIVADELGCESMDEVDISFPGSITLNILAEDDIICPNDTIQLFASGAEAYQWITGQENISNDSISDPLVFPDSSTVFTVYATNICYEDTASVLINVLPNNTMTPNDTCIISGQEVTLTAEGGDSYMWTSDTYFIADSTSSSIFISPTDSTDIKLVILDSNGCIWEDSFHIAVLNSYIEAIKIVNAFSPNDDRFNDYLVFSGLNKITENSLIVYNRWGNIVYEKENYQNDWNGYYKGKPLPEGSYYYVLKIGETEIRNALTLLRN